MVLTQRCRDILSVLGNLVYVINFGEVHDLVEGDDVLIVVFLGNADCVQEVEILADFQFFGGDLSELLVLQSYLDAVVDIGPRERVLKIHINTIQARR